MFAQMTQAHINYMLSKIPLGRLGEPQEVAALLSEMQYGDIHVGSAPQNKAVYGQIKTMRKRLKDAVAENDFTLAAQLRDRIHELESV